MIVSTFFLGNKTKIGCNLCKKNDTFTLADHRKRESYMQGDAACVMHIYSDYCRNEINKIDEYLDASIRNFRVVFTVENETEIRNIMSEFMGA